ncbi:hypothetical protein BJP34_15335 [Moorena producens PAL-8-15-08-1]|uniref:Uncharacterized protein n=1 Tax=Moorena producens PAL-8-15-08-1 TaxID=1458985 RepID=A0A1D8TSQ9_9CYAN|nr:hypothetical protein BJP34_15335 [Moorena producens PAL-8-15-08-1]
MIVLNKPGLIVLFYKAFFQSNIAVFKLVRYKLLAFREQGPGTRREQGPGTRDQGPGTRREQEGAVKSEEERGKKFCVPH